MDHSQVIIRPVVSEKSYVLATADKYTFRVHPDAHKTQIKQAVEALFDGVNAQRSPERAMIVVTHYQRLLNYIVPDQVHVLANGFIVKSGGKELALELEEKGYGWLEEAAAQATLAGKAAECRT